MILQVQPETDLRPEVHLVLQILQRAQTHGISQETSRRSAAFHLSSSFPHLNADLYAFEIIAS